MDISMTFMMTLVLALINLMTMMFAQITHMLDGSNVYGSDDEDALDLRLSLLAKVLSTYPFIYLSIVPFYLSIYLFFNHSPPEY